MSDAQRLINVMRQTIDQSTGTQVNYLPGVVHEVTSVAVQNIQGVTLLLATSYLTDSEEGFVASAYVRSDELLEDIIIPSGVFVSAGDYVVVAQSESGRAWIDRLLAESAYPMLYVDFNRAKIGTGSGSNDIINWGTAGQIITSGGSASPVSWGPIFEEGYFTPEITFETPGDLSVSYSDQEGFYTRLGSRCFVTIYLSTNSFTHTTASGGFRMTGLPFTANRSAAMALSWEGYTWTVPAWISAETIPGSTNLQFRYLQSGGQSSDMESNVVLSGTEQEIWVSGSYEIQP